MTYDEFRNGIREAVESMNDSDLVNAWNEICDNENYMDDYIWFNDPDELLAGRTPSEVLGDVTGDYSVNDEYAVWTVYGLESFNYTSDSNCPIDIDMIVDYIIDNEEDFDDSDIEELLDQWNEEKEEDEE
jgi:hypothetical protein